MLNALKSNCFVCNFFYRYLLYSSNKQITQFQLKQPCFLSSKQANSLRIMYQLKVDVDKLNAVKVVVS